MMILVYLFAIHIGTLGLAYLFAYKQYTLLIARYAEHKEEIHMPKLDELGNQVTREDGTHEYTSEILTYAVNPGFLKAYLFTIPGLIVWTFYIVSMTLLFSL